MPAVILDPLPVAVQRLLVERAQLGLDRRDETWQGAPHMIPPPSHAHELLTMRVARLLGPYADAAGLELTGAIGIGTGPEDYRVPDLALHRAGAAPQWHPTAALVVEIVSPGDETWQKLAFYAAHRIDELLIVDPAERQIHWLTREAESYRPLGHESDIVKLSPAALARQLAWPR